MAAFGDRANTTAPTCWYCGGFIQFYFGNSAACSACNRTFPPSTSDAIVWNSPRREEPANEDPDPPPRKGFRQKKKTKKDKAPTFTERLLAKIDEELSPQQRHRASQLTRRRPHRVQRR